MRLADIPRHLLQSWEIYLILFLSAFLHLVNIDKAIFNIDETDFYSMARDAVTSGWLPLTGTRASLGNFNPPFVMYLFMLPASLSSNPLWGQVLVALVNTAAVLLTYFFVRRYYGRLAGTIAALLYSTSAGAWTFSRNIWNPNFLPFFVMLFIFMLFRGVVERRKGWLFWAILLMGVLYQFHGSALYLLIPLAAAVFFAYKTIRLRDIALSIVALLLLFAPYIIWEFHVHFVDITLLFSSIGQQVQIDTEALHFYLFFIHPTLTNPYLDLGARIRDTHLLLPDDQSILIHSHLLTLLLGAYLLSILLLLGGIFIAVVQIFSVHAASATEPKKGIIARWWTEFQANPSRQGLVLLLLWQIAPLLLLTRHSIVLFVHYFIFFLPGQFILMALCVVQIIALARQIRPSWERIARYGASTLAALVILAQLIGLGSAIIDISAGHFQSAVFSDLRDQQNALQMADQVAQQRHINRIYLTSFPSYIKINSMEYLSQQTKTPAEFFTIDNCFILPSPAAGPVVFLTTSGNALAETLFNQYASATLVDTSPHLGSAPYQIYVVTAKPEPAPVPHTFNQNLQLLSPTVQLLQDAEANLDWLTTRWSVLSAHDPAFRTTYGFNFQVDSVAGSPLHDNLNCTPTSTWAGDQLFIFHSSQYGDLFPSQVALQVSTFVSRPQTLALGPLTGFTDYTENTDRQTLLTDDRKNSITLPTTIN
jgi:4-amino-4-deoxy-L-arabinose transferase-like glycosyltransferase